MTISVYITSYNQKVYLVEAIESVLAQTLRPHQVIIVDDCSTDGSPDVIQAYAARYPELITPIFHQENMGVAQTRIDALRAVTGEYVTYVDGDDRILPHKLEHEMAALRANPEARIAFANVLYIDSEGHPFQRWASESEHVPQGDVFQQVFARDFPRRTLYRAELVHYPTWRKIGFYDPHLDLYEDWEMRIRLTKQCRTVYVDDVLSEYRVHAGGLSAAKTVRLLEACNYVLQKNQPLLADLSRSERTRIKRSLDNWLCHFNRRAASQALAEGQRWRALKYFVRGVRQNRQLFDMRLLLQMLLPSGVIRLATPLWHRFKGG